MVSLVFFEPIWSTEVVLSSISLLVMIPAVVSFVVVKRQMPGTYTAPNRAPPVGHRHQPTLPNDHGLYKWNVQIPSARGDLAHAVALLDTQCQKGNWISSPLLERIGKTHEIQVVPNALSLRTANGGSITTRRKIALEWKRQDGNNFYIADFYVFPPNAITLDIIFGADYIFENKILLVDEYAMLPLLESNKNVSPDEQKVMDTTQARVQQQKAALAAKRQQNESSQLHRDHQHSGKQQVG